ncbi:DNA topoisomerase (ATP-hydrolyzing) [Amycolatopsis sp. NPDC004368]
MARRKGTTTKVDPTAFDSAGANVFDNSLKTEIEDSYLEYAYSVIHSRALPDARDGLKPVHRRILYSMNENGYRPTHAYVKSSRVVGDCFVRGALVSTPAGLRPIEDIEIGDDVLDARGQAVTVTEVYENPASELVRVTWSNGHTMLVTPGQRFRTVAEDSTLTWTAARDLTDRLTVAYGKARRDTGLDLQVRREGLLGNEFDSAETVPAAVLGDRSRWAPYLAALFDREDDLGENAEIVYTGTNEKFVRQVYAMLADLGIHSRHWTNPETGLLGLSVDGSDVSALAPILRPGSEAGASLSAVSGAKVRYGKDRHGTALADRSFPLARARQDGWIDKLRRIGSPLADRLDALNGYSFLEVVSVEPVAPDVTYDIQVGADEHTFVTEGFVVHNCMGKYHPHGDVAIYDAMVRLAQDFSLNVPLIDGHGNFGSPDDGPAASRYTEARMSPEAMLLVGELGEDTVDFRPNYDGSLEEPTVLPAAYPNLLVNGTSGIAVGMATNMIPHNLGEVIAAARWLITHPTATLDKLMEFVPGPDLPTGGKLLGLDEVRRAYETGRGVVRMRATCETGPLEGSRGRQAITVVELPYGVGPEKVIEKITDEVNKSKRLTGIADVKDLTDRENGTRLVIECKVGVNPQALLADLYRLTPLEQSFGINNLVLVDGQPQTLGLKELLEVFLRHRYDVVTRRTSYRRRKREERLHLVDGLLIALLNIDKVIKLIRESENAQAAKDGLMTRFKLSEIQATYILDTPLRRLTKYDRLELESEQERLREEIAELTKILEDDSVLRKLVSAELAKIAKDFPTERRTALIDGDLKEVLAASKPSGPLEVADDPCQVILSATGLVARTAAESEESSEVRRRNGRVKHDAVSAIVHTTARGQVLLVTSRGRAFKTDVLPLPVLPEQAGTVSLRGGMAARELVPLEKGETVIGVAPLGEQAAGSPGLAIGTRAGVVKVVAPEWPVRSDEFEIITLKTGDEIVGATWLTDGNETLAFMSSEASLLRFAASLVRPQGLKGGGMAGINLGAGASAVFFGAVRTDDDDHGEPMVVTATGQSVKVTPFSEYPAKGRATGGVRAHRFLKGETAVTVAWIGPRPAGSARNGDPVELPEVDLRRDGSGHAHPGPDVVGHTIERD